jgi:uncharacterized C2H2 Zn-finger protein
LSDDEFAQLIDNALDETKEKTPPEKASPKKPKKPPRPKEKTPQKTVSPKKPKKPPQPLSEDEEFAQRIDKALEKEKTLPKRTSPTKVRPPKRSLPKGAASVGTGVNTKTAIAQDSPQPAAQLPAPRPEFWAGDEFEPPKPTPPRPSLWSVTDPFELARISVLAGATAPAKASTTVAARSATPARTRALKAMNPPPTRQSPKLIQLDNLQTSPRTLTKVVREGEQDEKDLNQSCGLCNLIDADVQRVQCHRCGIFESHATLMKHLRQGHTTAVRFSSPCCSFKNEYWMMCPLCGEWFLSRLVTKHIQASHANVASQFSEAFFLSNPVISFADKVQVDKALEDALASQPPPSNVNLAESNRTCPLCHIVFASYRDFISHAERHHDEGQRRKTQEIVFVCTIHELLSFEKETMEAHMQTMYHPVPMATRRLRWTNDHHRVSAGRTMRALVPVAAIKT